MHCLNVNLQEMTRVCSSDMNNLQGWVDVHNPFLNFLYVECVISVEVFSESWMVLKISILNFSLVRASQSHKNLIFFLRIMLSCNGRKYVFHNCFL